MTLTRRLVQSKQHHASYYPPPGWWQRAVRRGQFPCWKMQTGPREQEGNPLVPVSLGKSSRIWIPPNSAFYQNRIDQPLPPMGEGKVSLKITIQVLWNRGKSFAWELGASVLVLQSQAPSPLQASVSSFAKLSRLYFWSFYLSFGKECSGKEDRSENNE